MKKGLSEFRFMATQKKGQFFKTLDMYSIPKNKILKTSATSFGMGSLPLKNIYALQFGIPTTSPYITKRHFVRGNPQLFWEKM